MARPYKTYQYVYPPRPEHKILPSSLPKYDTGEYFGQPKLNGSCCEIYVNGVDNHVMNRHDGNLTLFNLKDEEINKLHQGNGFDMFVGEYMNKSKDDENGNKFNHKFVIFDIIINKGKHLTGTTYEQRISMLYSMFPNMKSYNDYLYQISENIFIVKTFDKDFEKLFNIFAETDMLEGLVLKRKSGKLENARSAKNNMGWQMKARKETKNYTF